MIEGFNGPDAVFDKLFVGFSVVFFDVLHNVG
jgi:hypothetical protein